MSKINSEITITGNPTDEEVAAVVAVLTARAPSAPASSDDEEPKSGWAAYWRSVGAPVQPGPGSWQAVYRG